MEYIALALSLVAVILCIVILSKVNKLLTMLRTPIFKKLTPDMNLKPSARRPISAQEMAQRGGNNKENRQNKERPNNNKDNRNQQAAHAPATRDRNEQRPERGPRRERRPERPHREPNAEAPAAEQTAPVAPAAAEAPAAETRRPLAPRIPVETPAAPAVEAAPVAPVAEAPAEAPAENVFDPSKVRYGRRNVIKKAPELADED